MILQKDLIYSLDWDILVILDACRYDTLKDALKHVFLFHSAKKIELEKCRSLGSCTMEWFTNTFEERIPNSIYISANPYIGNYRNAFQGIEYDPRWIFDSIRCVWVDSWRKFNGIYCIHPSDVTRVAMVRMKINPRRKFIIHYMQPHAPYPLSPELKQYFTSNINNPEFKLWEALKRGELDPQKTRNAYYTNLLWALEYVKSIVRILRRKKVILTSDHGECFGERGLYGHPCGKKIPELRDIPWCVITT